MLRGKKHFACKDCGHKFIGLDIEDNATVNSMPVKCPKCGSWHTEGDFSYTALIDKVVSMLSGNKRSNNE